MKNSDLIKKITDYHPASKAGIERGWSYYIGGMKDAGDWYYKKLLSATDKELQKCLDDLIEEWKPTSKIYTEEELRHRNNVISFDNMTWFTKEYLLNQEREFLENQEMEFLNNFEGLKNKDKNTDL